MVAMTVVGRRKTAGRGTSVRIAAAQEACRAFRGGGGPVYLEGDDFRVAERPAAERRHRPL